MILPVRTWRNIFFFLKSHCNFSHSTRSVISDVFVNELMISIQCVDAGVPTTINIMLRVESSCTMRKTG